MIGGLRRRRARKGRLLAKLRVLGRCLFGSGEHRWICGLRLLTERHLPAIRIAGGRRGRDLKSRFLESFAVGKFAFRAFGAVSRASQLVQFRFARLDRFGKKILELGADHPVFEISPDAFVFATVIAAANNRTAFVDSASFLFAFQVMAIAVGGPANHVWPSQVPLDRALFQILDRERETQATEGTVKW